jgi:ABC-2 type transport system ATP-binding protein
MPTIEVRSLVKKYGDFTAVNGISFDVEAGEIFGFLGPNGAGKTTTIHILCALLQPTSGTVLINGVDVSKDSMKAREYIGLVFQDTSVDNQLTGRENLQIHGELYGVPRDVIEKRIPEVLNLVELSEWADKLASTYSGGMRRRLEIARGLLHQPRVLFLDEPTLGLDPQTRAHIWQYVMGLQQEQKVTIFITTHYLDEAEHCSRIAIIDHGEIIATDTPAHLKTLAGEDIITMDTDDNELATKIIKERFGITAKQGVDGLQFEVAEGAKFIPRFTSAFSEANGYPQILNISLRRPTLDDVFLKITGRAIREEGASGREQLRTLLKRG